MSSTTTAAPRTNKTLTVLDKAHRAETHPDCVLSFQRNNLAQGLVRIHSVHPDERKRVGYKALAFRDNGELADCYDVQETPGSSSTRQSLPEKGVVVSFHWGLFFGGGCMFITEITSEKERETHQKNSGKAFAKETRGKRIGLVSRQAVPEDYTGQGILAMVKSKNPWIHSFFRETYEDVVLDREHKHGIVALKNRQAYLEAKRFADHYGIELDNRILSGTAKVHFRKHKMPTEEELAKQLLHSNVWDPVASRGFECEFYGVHVGLPRSAKPLSENLENEDEALAFARQSLHEYDELVRVTTVFHLGRDEKPRPAFYMFLIYSKTVTEQESGFLKDSSEFTALVDKYVKGELTRDCFPEPPEDETASEEVAQATEAPVAS